MDEESPVEELALMRARLVSMAVPSDNSGRLAALRALEELRSAVAAAQLAVTSAFVDDERLTAASAGLTRVEADRAIAAQIGIARRVSPNQASRFTGLAVTLPAELPATWQALREGRCSEWRATLLTRETAWLSREHRAAVDAELAPLLDRLGDRRLINAVRTTAYRLDPQGLVDRLGRAENERRVTVRPAPDAMVWLTALLPVAQGIAAYAALRKAADTAISVGDARSRDQITADTLVERLTGQTTADATPVEICLVMNETTLLGQHADTGTTNPVSDAPRPTTVQPTVAAPEPAGHRPGRDEPVHLLGYGPLPTAWARLLLGQLPDTTPAWIRRLHRHPASGQLMSMDSRRRRFPANQRLFLRLTADDVCTTPYCAPVRHADHAVAWTDGGPTSVSNGNGACEHCNYANYALTLLRPTASIEVDLTGVHRAA